MAAILLLAILAVILFGAGFALHLLWWVAIVFAVVWLLGFLVRPGGGRRWYYW
jgi:hypothetical protein